MKVVHVLKKIETIDNDIKELRKMEKSLHKNKSFTTPIYLSIEKQINILLDERIKMLGLRIENPPPSLAGEMEKALDDQKKVAERPQEKKKNRIKKIKSGAVKSPQEEIPVEDIPIMTQDLIDEKIKKINREAGAAEPRKLLNNVETNLPGDESVKLLDIALEKGSISKNDIDKEKKKVRFFKENFPGGEY